MAKDPRRAVVDVIARLGRETQLHLDERYRHFRITDAVIIVVSLLMVVLATFNVYYVHILYKDLEGILNTMESMYGHVKGIDEDMHVITRDVEAFDRHMAHMEPIYGHMTSLADTMPQMRANMKGISEDVGTIEQRMGLLSQGMGVIDHRVHLMVGGVATMRENVRQIAQPMGSMSPFVP